MRKQEKEALRRLEQALLEAETPEEEISEEDPPEWEEEYYDAPDETPTGFTVRNTDQTDVDLEDYSEEVYRGSKGGCLISGLVTVIALCVLAAMVLWLLQYLGVEI